MEWERNMIHELNYPCQWSTIIHWLCLWNHVNLCKSLAGGFFFSTYSSLPYQLEMASSQLTVFLERGSNQPDINDDSGRRFINKLILWKPWGIWQKWHEVSLQVDMFEKSHCNHHVSFGTVKVLRETVFWTLNSLWFTEVENLKCRPARKMLPNKIGKSKEWWLVDGKGYQPKNLQSIINIHLNNQ